MLERSSYTLASIYAPNSQQLNFLETTFLALLSFKDDPIILERDLNCVSDTKWDRSHYLHQKCSKKEYGENKEKSDMAELCEKIDLFDVWRVQNPNVRDFTFHQGFTHFPE